MTDPFIPLATLSDDEIFARLATVVGQSLRIDPARVTRDTSLDALGAESIDLVEITLDVEHAFTVRMPERTILDVAADVEGAGVFERDGCLTELGADLLRSRLPATAAAEIAAGMAIGPLARLLLRIDVWVGLIRGLLDATPRVCPQCGGRLRQGGPDRVRCSTCPMDIDVPSGDELGAAWVRRWLAARSR